ncbi:MAG: thioredoxin family protein [Betaproteobacteria bacterium]
MNTSRRSTIIAAALAVLACALPPATAAPVVTEHVTAQIVSENRALVPGTTATVALRLEIRPGWHTYWRNPGESGLPTTLDWRLPSGYVAGAIEWPAPHTLAAGPLTNYGYEGTVLHLVPVQVPVGATPGSDVALTARAEWLVCKETCIPEGVDLALTLPVAARAEPDPRWQLAIAATREALPRAAPAALRANAVAAGATVTLSLAAAPTTPAGMHFFADRERQIEPSAAQRAVIRGNVVELSLPVSHDLATPFQRLQGVLTSDTGFVVDGRTVRAVALDVPVTGVAVAGPKPAPLQAPALSSSTSAAMVLPVALAFAFGGGLLLNLMPCVFPVLSLKALSLVSSDAGDRRGLRIEGAAFAAGVVLAFVALALAIIGLRAAGEELGWGFQLQSPAVVAALALLFFVMALNLSGVFEFGTLLPSRLASWSHEHRSVNAFASGLLAVAIASPCTAPFMGAALGYALGQRAVVTLAIFVALGVGMSVPYVALACFPAWRRWLPRPGAWMQRLKQLLAFPLYATVAWLVWVLGAQTDNDGVLRIGAALVLVAFALWSWRTRRGGGNAARSAAAIAGAAVAAIVAWPLLHNVRGAEVAAGERDAPGARADGWEPYSADRVAELVALKRPVFVDFTAAWCVTCQVNERLVLSDDRVRAAFARNDVALLRADWTRRDPAITRALSALGRSGVPVYAFYRRDGVPTLLPEVLQRDALIDAVDDSRLPVAAASTR